MFNGRLSSGKHLICDIKGIKNDTLLNSVNYMKNMLSDICLKFNFQILDKTQYEFEPQGCSILFLLSESHISLHSFPEKQHVSFDLYTCRDYETNNEYEEIYEYLINIFDASEESTITIIDRFF